MWIVVTFAGLSLGYVVVSDPLDASWVARWLAMTATTAVMIRIARLAIPHHRVGPPLAVAFVMLIPRVPGLVVQSSANPFALLLAAVTAYLAFKVYLRDGPKFTPLLIAGVIMGVGLSISPAFLQVLPWTLMPVWTAGRGGRKSYQSVGLVAVCLSIGFIASRIVFPSGAPAAQADPAGAQTAWGLIRALGSPTLFVSLPVDLLYAALSIVVVIGFLLGAATGSKDPELFDAGAWRRPWRLSPQFGFILLLGILSMGGWGVVSAMSREHFPRVDEFYLAKPWIVLLASLGFANVSDWVRRRRYVGNFFAEHLVKHALAIHVLANLHCLWRLL